MIHCAKNRLIRARLIAILSVSLTALSACGGGGSVNSREAPTPVPTATPQNALGSDADFTPNNFLLFVNKQVGLVAGGYSVVVGTAQPGTTGSFTLRIVFDDESEQSFQGTWDAAQSGGADSAYHPGNPQFALELAAGGGLIIEADATEDAVIFLLKDRQILARADAQTGGGVEQLVFARSPINSRAFADSYYATVDPMNLRNTLEGWKQQTDFYTVDPNEVVNAVFRDVKDLGYGRDMYAWEHSCGIAVFEDNYVVQLEPGDATTYGPLNLDAAVERDRRYLAGSNALEFGPPGGADSGLCNDPSTWVVSFYTYAPPDSGPDENGQPCPAGEQCRQKEVDFDGRGLKFMPGVCVVCHGGKLSPAANGSDFGDALAASKHTSIKSSSFSVLNPESLEFSDAPGFTFDAQQANVAGVNALVKKVFSSQQTNRIDAADNRGNWSPTFATEWLDGFLANPTQQASTQVPTGWQEAAGAPAGAEALYAQVVEPYCLGCHALRGSKVGEENDANAVNFSSYDKFMAYAETSKDYVFRRGTMPLSLISFAQFWQDPVAPKLLADTLGLDDRYRDSAGGNPLEPGRPVAMPGADRVVFFPVLPEGAPRERRIELNGSASLFSSRYSWRIIEPADGAGATLESANSAVATLTVTEPGVFKLGLVTGNEEFGDSIEAEKHIELTSEVLDDRETVFVAGGDLQDSVAIEQLFSDAGCTTCHSTTANAEFVGISVYFDRVSYPASGGEAAFYRAVRQRINFAEPRASLLLTKPLSDLLRHAGSVDGPLFRDRPCEAASTEQTCIDDPELEAIKYSDYQKMLAWIENGAPCGGEDTVCGFARTETAPLTPTGLVIADPVRVAGGGQAVELAWTDNAVNETAFIVQRATSSDFAAANTVLLSPAPPTNNAIATTFDDTGAAASTTYYYRVAAENSVGRSEFSNTVTLSTLVPPSPPAPINIAAAAVSDSEVSVTWSAGSSTGASTDGTVTAFTVERRASGTTDFAAVASSLAPSATSYLDSGLSPTTSYDFRVCAAGEGDAVRACSAVATATTLAEPPPEPTLFFGGQTSTTVDIGWVPGVGGGVTTGFEIERRLAAPDPFVQVNGLLQAGDSPYTDTGLVPNTSYEYRVCAIGAAGVDPICSTPSSIVTAPVAPTISSVVVWSDREVQVTWAVGASTGPAPDFTLERSTGGAVEANIALATPAALYEDQGLAADTSYSYRVCATGQGVNNIACSAATSRATVAAGDTLWAQSWSGQTCSSGGCHGSDVDPAGGYAPFAIAGSVTVTRIYNAITLDNSSTGGVTAMNSSLLNDPADAPNASEMQEARMRSVCFAMNGAATGTSPAGCNTATP